MIKNKNKKHKKRNIIKSSNKKNYSNNILINDDPAFQTNKTLKKYIYEKLSLNIFKEKEEKEKYLMEVNKNFNYSNSTKNMHTTNSFNNFVYYKKNSNILSYLKSKNPKNKKFSINNSNHSIYKEFSNCNNNDSNEKMKHKFSSSISLKDLNNNQNKIDKFVSSLSSSISQEKIRYPSSSRFLYRKVGNIFNRSECQFSKIKNNIEIKNKLFKNIKNIKYGINNIENNNEIDDIDNIRELERENIYLRKMMKISENKLNIRKNQLEKLMMIENQRDQKYEIQNKIKRINSAIKEIIKNKENSNPNNININKNKNDKNLETESIIKEEKLYDYLDEPLEQIAPKPYIIKIKY